MKKIIFIGALLLAVTEINAQETKIQKETISTEFNKWSVDVNAGLSKPTAPFSTNYYSSNANFIHGDLGVRYMLNNKFGLKLDFGLDSFKNDSESFEFEGKYYRTSLQGVVNLGRVLNFEDWTNTINLQAHSGVGFSFMTNDKFDGNDDMTNFILGLTAQFKLSNRVALNADFSMINNINQEYTFDGVQDPAVASDRGFNSTLYNASLGLSIYLGKHERHADWVTSNSKLDELERRVAELETKLLDTDKDGVADYLDEEKNSAQNILVDTKGKTLDTNKNGVDDKVEAYVDNKTKVTSTEGQSIEDMINSGYITVFFDFNSVKPTADSYSAINFVTQYLKSNPNSNVEIVGFADEIGNSEYNKTLSASRANFVKDVIVKAGINASRLNVTGQGEDTSVDASSADARRLVRKVIFKLK
ncbi:MAG: OmpA family protein [Flavobacterium sp.]|nr:MAG: OmpA family protein [Flavobacterium sp.]